MLDGKDRHWVDGHTHCSDFSPDASRDLNALLKEADRIGLAAVALSDHYDKDGISGRLYHNASPPEGPPAEGEWIFDVASYFKRLLPLRAERDARADGAALRIGIELGYAPYLEDDYARLLTAWPFDEVICSLHFIHDRDIYFYREFYEDGKTKFYREWLEMEIKMAEAAFSYDVLGHYDYVTRYAPYDDPSLRYDEFADHFDELLKTMIKRDIALEINLRSMSKAKGKNGSDALSSGGVDKRLLKRFLDLGGQLICMHSDSHENGSLGAGFDACAQALWDCGIRKLCAFKQRKPYFIPLD